MMNCTRFELSLSRRADGQPLSVEEARLLDAHLEDCPGCRRVLREEEARSSLLRRKLSRGSEELAPVARRILLAAASAGAGEAEGPRRRATPLLALPLAGGLAAAAAAFGLAAFWWSPAALEGPAGRPVHIVLEEERNDTDLVPVEDDRAVGRDTHQARWIIYDVPSPRARVPARSRAEGELIFDAERVDTRYYQPVSFEYR